MSRKLCIFSFFLLALALAGCSSTPPVKQAKRPLDKVQGKALEMVDSGGATDSALNAGGPSIYLVADDNRRYRLFLKTAVEIIQGKEYIAEGVDAQKAIDEIGDPDQGKNGYPLQASCEKVVTMAWNNLSFDAFDATVSLVKARVNRYPARPLFLVTGIQEAPETKAGEPQKDDSNIPEITVAADKEKASLIEGPTVLGAPLWDAKGDTVSCKVFIDTEGKIAELETGIQLCESVPWAKFRFQKPMQGGHPVKVHTEVEIKFEPRATNP